MKFTSKEKKIIEATAKKLPESKLIKSQKTTFKKNYEDDYGDDCLIIVEVRYDDECDNGHNTFTITGSVYSKSAEVNLMVACGCIHDEISKHFPQLRKYLKWHGITSEGPLYYYNNSIYFAGDRDCNGKRKGEPTGTEIAVYVPGVDGNPVEIPFFTDDPQDVLKFIAEVVGERMPSNRDNVLFEAGPFKIVEEPSKYQTIPDDRYYGTFTIIVSTNDGEKKFIYNENSYLSCWPFMSFGNGVETKRAVERFVTFFNNVDWQLKEMPVGYAEGKEPELEAARNTAVWPEAQLEDFTVEKLAARLPGLMEEFKRDIEELGFTY